MPNNVIDSPRDEHKWEKAEQIAEKSLGHKPKSDRDWAYVMGIYKKMKPDHKFESEKSASNVVDQWMTRRVVARKTDIQKFYDIVERGLAKRPKEATFGVDHIYLWFSERFSGGWRIDFEANIRTDGRKVWLEIQGERNKYTNPNQAAKAINERRDHETDMVLRAQWNRSAASDKEARVQTTILKGTLKRKVNIEMRKAGLDGNRRFRKPQDGYSVAVGVMQDWNIEIYGTAHSHLFNADSGKVTVSIAMTNDADRFSPFPITNSMLVIQFHKLENNRYEVLGYLS